MFESFQWKNDSKQQIVLTTNLWELLTLNMCWEGFFASICNITSVLQNWRISLNRDFDREILVIMCAETINYGVKYRVNAIVFNLDTSIYGSSTFVHG